MSRVEAGDRLRVHYTIRREDGSVFDSSRAGEPLALTAGSAEFIAAVSEAVIGMSVGESKSVVVRPEEAYGRYRPGLSRRVPRRAVPADAAVGEAVEAKVGEDTAVLWIKELHPDHAVIDPNHPLAGQTLELEIEIVAIED